MYDQYPIHDVPQKNIIQRFFAQRWSAILLEVVMTIVITVAAGAAFDFFDPFEKAAAPPAMEQSPRARLQEYFERRAVYYVLGGQHIKAIAMYNLLIDAEPTAPRHYYNRGLMKHYRGDYSGAYDDLVMALNLERDCGDRDCRLAHARGKSKLVLAFRNRPAMLARMEAGLALAYAKLYLAFADECDHMWMGNKARRIDEEIRQFVDKNADYVTQSLANALQGVD
jgi:tetratricopeptide (TPR) repeat protein